MKERNIYPVKFRDFLRIKSIGNYVVNYAILDDRVHLELPLENAVYVTQKFKLSIEEELEAKAQNYTGDPIQMFLKMNLTNTTFYRFYPTSQQIVDLKRIKLYDKIIIKESKAGIYDKENVKIFETDTYMKAVDGDEVVLFGEKE